MVFLYLSKEHLDKALKAKEVLAQLYPHCFKPDGEKPIPLQLKIAKELKKLRQHNPSIPSNSAINNFLSIYSTSKEYIKCLQEPDAMRIDLEGNPVEPVSEKHRAFAQKAKPKEVKIKTPPEPIPKKVNSSTLTVPKEKSKDKPKVKKVSPEQLIPVLPQKSKTAIIIKKKKTISQQPTLSKHNTATIDSD